MIHKESKLLVSRESKPSVLQYTYAYNVYTGKFWDGIWYTATRKFAKPVTFAFIEEFLHSLAPSQRTNMRFIKAAK